MRKAKEQIEKGGQVHSMYTEKKPGQDRGGQQEDICRRYAMNIR